jgi:hypothetical protein
MKIFYYCRFCKKKYPTKAKVYTCCAKPLVLTLAGDQRARSRTVHYGVKQLSDSGDEYYLYCNNNKRLYAEVAFNWKKVTCKNCLKKKAFVERNK